MGEKTKILSSAMVSSVELDVLREIILWASERPCPGSISRGKKTKRFSSAMVSSVELDVIGIILWPNVDMALSLETQGSTCSLREALHGTSVRSESPFGQQT